jgi:hypothetical protein
MKSLAVIAVLLAACAGLAAGRAHEDEADVVELTAATLAPALLQHSLALVSRPPAARPPAASAPQNALPTHRPPLTLPPSPPSYSYFPSTHPGALLLPLR